MCCDVEDRLNGEVVGLVFGFDLDEGRCVCWCYRFFNSFNFNDVLDLIKIKE